MTTNTLFLTLLAGWLAGGAANWAADVLPGWGRAQRGRLSLRTLPHYWTLWWYPWRGGRCPHCGEVRPWRAPALELAMPAVFAVTWRFVEQWPPLLVIVWLYACFLLAVLVIDLEHRRVLNIMLAPAAALVILLSFTSLTRDPWPTLLGGLVGFGLFVVFALIGRGALGAGDVKLAGVIGLMTGYPEVLTALLLGIILGGVAALALLASRRATRKSYMAYAPYLALGALVTLWTTFGG
jgi:prepilin signal peptidase PulO-like enzyme (type II secretory pathway)